VKGFKEGMKEGGAEEAKPTEPAQQVGQTIEGQAKKEETKV
jgi:hypothetical protein